MACSKSSVTFAHVRGVIGTNRYSESECVIRGATGSRSQLSPEPRAGDAPIALHSLGRNAQDLRRFLDCQPADITKLHDFRLAGIELRETIQGAIEVLPETEVGVDTGRRRRPTERARVRRRASHDYGCGRTRRGSHA